MKDAIFPTVNSGKFINSAETADGSPRAHVSLGDAKTLWFNTGTLCNITCVNCYIDSSPTNDALVYLTENDVRDYLDQIKTRNWPVKEIGFTGGEPFMNRAIIAMTRISLEQGFKVLILTNAMLPMMRKTMRDGLLALENDYPGQMTLRISVDHYTAQLHDKERGKGSFSVTLRGMEWLRDNGIKMTIAGRTTYGQTDTESRLGYDAFFREHNFNIDAQNPADTVLFPEMDMNAQVPEITTACWGILNKSPSDVMCASARMVVKRKGAETPVVLACTLLPYDPRFEMGTTLEDAEADVSLNHPHCAKFCVLGGASCSA